MRIPTRTKVSREARELILRSSSHSTGFFSNSKTIVEPPNKTSDGEFHKGTLHTEGEISKFLTTGHMFSFLNSGDNATDHHRPNANGEHSAKDWTVNGNNLPSIFPINVKTENKSVKTLKP